MDRHEDTVTPEQIATLWQDIARAPKKSPESRAAVHAFHEAFKRASFRTSLRGTMRYIMWEREGRK